MTPPPSPPAAAARRRGGPGRAATLAAAALLLAVAGCAPPPRPVTADGPPALAALPEPLPAARRFPPRRPPPPARSNAEMAQDVLELAFRLESGRRLERLTRFEGPVTVGLAGAVPPLAADDLADLMVRLRGEAGIDIRPAGAGRPAAITVEFLPRRRLQAAVPQAACYVVPAVSSFQEFEALRGTERIDWARLERRERAAVFIPSDASPQDVRDCLHEEVAQALGPLNDLYRLSDSVFNDDNFHAVLTGFDMLVLRVLNDPDLRSGMTEAEVAARLPALLDRMNPGGVGGRPLAPALVETPRAWSQAIEAALGARAGGTDRGAAARTAVAIARARGWSDVRTGFSYFALGRLSTARDAELALASFLQAAAIFRRLPGAAPHVAHAEMQLAAHALSAGQPDRALALANANLAAASEAQNGGLLATLLMIKAAALEAQGRPAEARAARLDSLGWARYGFGSDEAVRARLAEIDALAGLRARRAGG
ncbi:MAG: DUF2927 domain-containing protein [Rhodobacteraceae bacterium]|nr:DUF2927 domain-containing protein [Paracoccaceae bacterium]